MAPKTAVASKMRTSIGKVLLAASLFTSGVQGQTDPDPQSSIKALQSPRAAVRQKALEEVTSLSYSLEDARLREQIINVLFAQLQVTTNTDERSYLAGTLQSFLSHQLTPTRSFLQAESYLTDPDRNVRHIFWLAFYQQASQDALTPEIDKRLLAMTMDSRKEIQLEAMNWAIEATQNRQRMVDAPQSELGKQSLEIFEKMTKTEDPDLRNVAVYGVLGQYEFNRENAAEMMREHLDDSHGDTRSLILDFLTRRARFDPLLLSLRPALLERFRDEKLGENFPLIPDAELGLAAGGKRPERYRLALVLSLMGPLPQDVWDYLQTEALEQVHPGYLVQLAELQGPAGRPLLTKILKTAPVEEWAEWMSQIAAVGLPEAQISEALKVIREPVEEDAEFDQSYRTSLMAASLALSPVNSPKIIQALERQLSGSDPRAKAAAAYTLAVKEPGNQVALKAVSQSDWSKLYTGTDYLLLAAYRLRNHGLKATPTLKIDSPDSQLLLSWMLGSPSPKDAQPHFLELFEKRQAASQGEPGTGDDLLLLELEWLAENPRPVTKPGLEFLLRHESAEVRAGAEKALGALGEAGHLGVVSF